MDSVPGRLDPGSVVLASSNTSSLGLEARATGLQGQLRVWTLLLEASHGPVPGRDPRFPPCPLADEDEE